MGSKILTNFDLYSAKYLDSRCVFANIDDMNAFPSSRIPDGFETFVVANRTKYRYNKSESKWEALVYTSSDVQALIDESLKTVVTAEDVTTTTTEV